MLHSLAKAIKLVETRMRFDHPSGLCVDNKRDRIYVCDTHNHCVRYLDFRSGTVATLERKFDSPQEVSLLKADTLLVPEDCGRYLQQTAEAAGLAKH